MSAEPARDCPHCPRLVAYREENRALEPDWKNAPAPSFGDPEARFLIVGLAPGRTGANRTGRPFTGDWAGDLLYQTLAAFGFSEGRYDARPDDGLVLIDARVTNAVRCAPPQNKPIAAEINRCRGYLSAEIAGLSRLRVVLALGRVAHDSLARALGRRPAELPFGHGARHDVDGLTVYDSYHCSRYNTNTGRLTEAMFHAVFAAIRDELDQPPARK